MLVTVKSKKQLEKENFYFDNNGDAWICRSDFEEYRHGTLSVSNFSWMNVDYFGKTFDLLSLIVDLGGPNNSPGMYDVFVVEDLTPENIPEYFL